MYPDIHHVHREFETHGFRLVSGILNDAQCDGVIAQLQCSVGLSAGSRTMLNVKWCANLAKMLLQHVALQPMLRSDAVAVQCTLFDKTPQKNWLVALHQDLSIHVAERIDDPECTGWSIKEGHVFVQPPARVIEQLVAVRIHLDDCPADAGALRVIPGSHIFGRLSIAATEKLKTEHRETLVPAPRGAALIMRPLLLHASSKGLLPQPRRVLHFVFGPAALPLGLAWA